MSKSERFPQALEYDSLTQTTLGQAPDQAEHSVPGVQDLSPTFH